MNKVYQVLSDKELAIEALASLMQELVFEYKLNDLNKDYKPITDEEIKSRVFEEATNFIERLEVQDE